jgi:hypothetical protein
MNRSVLSIAAILFALTGCMPAPESSSDATGVSAFLAGIRDLLHSVQNSGKPAVTPEKIVRDVVGRVIEVPELTGTAPPIAWTFDADEFRQVEILERHTTEHGLTLVIFMITRSNPESDEDPVQISGKVRLQYEWRAGQWIITTIEPLTFRYSFGLST